MNVDLRPYFDESASASFDFDVDADLDVIPGRVTGSCALSGVSGSVELTGQARYRLETVCARCLRRVSRDETAALHRYLTREESGGYDEAYVQVESDLLDLDAFILEEVVLALPAVILCKPDCKGLCPVCGKDRNETACGCAAPGDPRWDALDGI